MSTLEIADLIGTLFLPAYLLAGLMTVAALLVNIPKSRKEPVVLIFVALLWPSFYYPLFTRDFWRYGKT